MKLSNWVIVMGLLVLGPLVLPILWLYRRSCNRESTVRGTDIIYGKRWKHPK